MTDMRDVVEVKTLHNPHDEVVKSYLDEGWDLLAISTGPCLTDGGGTMISYVLGRNV